MHLNIVHRCKLRHGLVIQEFTKYMRIDMVNLRFITRLLSSDYIFTHLQLLRLAVGEKQFFHNL